MLLALLGAARPVQREVFPLNLGVKPCKKVMCDKRVVFSWCFSLCARAIGLACKAVQELLISSPHHGSRLMVPLPSLLLISLQIKEG